MSDYKIPIIPKLNFQKDDNEHYFFKITCGKLESKENGKICDINNIEIDIFDKICIKFEIGILDYAPFFMDKISKEDGKVSYISSKKIKFFNINCDSGEYSINLLNFHLRHSSDSKNDPSKNFICGECDEIKFVKNANSIGEDEQVNVWNIIECSNTSHLKFIEFDSNNLNGIFLKSINTIDYPHEYDTVEDFEIGRKFQQNQRVSFNQLLGNDSFLFNQTMYSDINDEIIGNIDKLLMFYDSNIVPSRFLILESIDSNKLEIRIKSKNTYKLNGSSIFKYWPDNLFNFINSSYDSYVDMKDSEIDIDLLLYYYVWIKNEQYLEVKLMLCSTFLEVLKNNKLDPSKNEGGFYNKIIQRFNFFKLDSYKLLKFLQPEVVELIVKLENMYFNEEYSNKNVNKIFKRYKTELLFIFIKKYRNKITHSGRFKLTDNDTDDMINELISMFKKNYKIEEQIELIENIGEDIKVGLKNTKSLFNIYDQSKFFERIVEIILLKIFNTNCALSFNHNLDNSSPELDDFNSKKYIDKFFKK